MAVTVKFSQVVQQCIVALNQIDVKGADNCRALAAVHDDLGIVLQYLEQKEHEIDSKRQEASDDTNADTERGM